MKKITLCLMLILALIIVPGAIFAAEGIAEVDTYQELVDALADSTKTTIKLVGGFELDSTVAITRTVTILNGADYEITTKSNVVKSFEIKNTTDEYINVKFEGVTITNATAAGRCIDTRNDNINLTLSGVELNTTSAQNNQALTLGGSETTGKLKVEIINDSAISAGKAGYGIITFVPAHITIKDSFITGYAALFVKEGSEGLKVDVINSTLEGKNNHPSVNSEGNSTKNSFGTIVVDASNVTINVNSNSIIRSTGTGEQCILGDRSEGAVGNKFNISSATIDANGEFAYVGNTNTKLSVGLGVTSNVEIPTYYLPEDVAIEYDEEKDEFRIVERTIKVVGLENVVDAKEAEKILLDSFNEWVKENPEAAEEYNKTNVTIAVEVFNILDEDIENMPLWIWEDFVEALNKKDVNAKMSKKFVVVSVTAGNEGMGFDLTKLVKPIIFKIDIPELEKAADGYERKYYAVRARENSTSSEEEYLFDVLDAKESVDGKSLEITTEGISLYGVAYSDVEKPVTPPAADDDNKDETTVTPPADNEGPTGESGTGVVQPEKEPTVDTEKEEIPDSVPTGDNVIVYAVFAVVAMAGMAVTIKMRK